MIEQLIRRDNVATGASIRILRWSERGVEAPVLPEVKPGLQLSRADGRVLGSGHCEAPSEGC